MFSPSLCYSIILIFSSSCFITEAKSSCARDLSQCQSNYAALKAQMQSCTFGSHASICAREIANIHQLQSSINVQNEQIRKLNSQILNSKPTVPPTIKPVVPEVVTKQYEQYCQKKIQNVTNNFTKEIQESRAETALAVKKAAPETISFDLNLKNAQAATKIMENLIAIAKSLKEKLKQKNAIMDIYVLEEYEKILLAAFDIERWIEKKNCETAKQKNKTITKRQITMEEPRSMQILWKRKPGYDTEA